MSIADEDVPKPEVHSLIDSILGFAPSELVEGLGNRREAEDMLERTKIFPSSDDPISKTIGWFLGIVEVAIEGIFKGRMAEITAGYCLPLRQQDLIHGRLVGIGYRVVADGRKFREAISGHLWREGSIKWDKNRMDYDGVMYEEIVVTRPEHVTAVVEGLPYAKRPPEGVTKGRPSYNLAIEEAYEEIQKDYCLSFASHIPIIRQMVQETLGIQGNKNLGDSVIRKIVGAQFSREKAEIKKADKG